MLMFMSRDPKSIFPNILRPWGWSNPNDPVSIEVCKYNNITAFCDPPSTFLLEKCVTSPRNRVSMRVPNFHDIILT